MDRVVQSPGNAKERRIMLDVLGGSVDVIRSKLDSMFRQASFYGKDPIPSKGGERIIYRDHEGRRISTTTWSAKERRPVSKGASAVVYLAFPQDAH